MCIDAFAHSTRVIGLVARHIKAKYGGVLLVMTVLDGNASVFPGLSGLLKVKIRKLGVGFWNLSRSDLEPKMAALELLC